LGSGVGRDEPEDVARAVLPCCSLPQPAVIKELVIAPTKFGDPSADIEASRWIKPAAPGLISREERDLDRADGASALRPALMSGLAGR
jgi:hypothetical protein